MWDIARVNTDPAARHYDLLRSVLAGVDPEIMVGMKDEAGFAFSVPLREVLGINEIRPFHEPFASCRPTVSRYIDVAAREKVREMLPALSVFDEEQWALATSNWEVDEFHYRQKLEAERRHLEVEFLRSWPENEAGMKDRRDAEWQKLKAIWEQGEGARKIQRPGIKGKTLKSIS